MGERVRIEGGWGGATGEKIGHADSNRTHAEGMHCSGKNEGGSYLSCAPLRREVLQDPGFASIVEANNQYIPSNTLDGLRSLLAEARTLATDHVAAEATHQAARRARLPLRHRRAVRRQSQKFLWRLHCRPSLTVSPTHTLPPIGACPAIYSAFN